VVEVSLNMEKGWGASHEITTTRIQRAFSTYHIDNLGFLLTTTRIISRTSYRSVTLMRQFAHTICLSFLDDKREKQKVKRVYRTWAAEIAPKYISMCSSQAKFGVL